MAQAPQGIASLPAANDVQRVMGGGQMARRQRPDIDPLLTEAQAAYLAAGFLPGAGALEASGEAPEFPTSDMQFADMLRGPRAASLKENIEEGNYGTAALQGLSVLGDAASIIPVVGPAAGAVLKAPRAVQKASRVARAETFTGKDNLERSLEQANILEREAKGMDAPTLASWLTENVEDEYKPIANKVAQRLQFMRDEQRFQFPVTLVNLKDSSTGTLSAPVPSGIISPGTSGLVRVTGEDPFNVPLFLKGQDVAKFQGQTANFGTDFETALHELIHTATLPSTHTSSFAKEGQLVTPKIREFRDDLTGLRNYVVKNFNAFINQYDNADQLPPLEKAIFQARTNVLQNEDELIAWGMSNPIVRNWLDSIPYNPGFAEGTTVTAARGPLSKQVEQRADPFLLDRSDELVQGIFKLNPKAQQYAEGGAVKKEGPSVWDAMVASVLKYLDLPPKDFPALKKLMEPKDVSRPLEDQEDG
jgi:hypothetical protein